MERKEHFCEINGCTEKASAHFTWAQDRKCTREQHFCEDHACAVVHEYDHEHQVLKGCAATLQGATCFDVEVVVISETHDKQIIYLREVGGPEQLSVVTGFFEACSIALKLQGFQASRPLTHDAMLGTIIALGGSLQHVLIDKVDEGIYYAKACVGQLSQLVLVDMRPSDAVNLALTANCPIFFTNEVVSKMAMSS
ncbi:MAG: bifunctional nuclease family protein [Planctomycetales bacterium]|nr:bifunctional nuclease family protein [Planctomycetales bacterium]